MRVLPRTCLREAGIQFLFYAVCYLGLLALALAAPLLKQGAPPGPLGWFLLDQIVLLSLFALPLAFVTALLATIGRMREDGELTALMAAGVSTWAVCRAFLPLTIVLTLWLAFACHYQVPRAARSLVQGKQELLQQALVVNIRRRLPLWQDDQITLAAVATDADRLHRVFAVLRDDAGGMLACYAPEARWTADPDELGDLNSGAGASADKRSAILGLELRDALILRREDATGAGRVLTGLAPSYTLAVPDKGSRVASNTDTMTTPELWRRLAAPPAANEKTAWRRALERSLHLRFVVPAAIPCLWAFACGLGLTIGRGNRLLAVFLGLGTVLLVLMPGFGLATSLEGSLTVNAGWLLWPPLVITGALGGWWMWARR